MVSKFDKLNKYKRMFNGVASLEEKEDKSLNLSDYEDLSSSPATKITDFNLITYDNSIER